MLREDQGRAVAGGGRRRRAVVASRVVGASTAVAMVLAGTAPLIAQTANPLDDRNVPFGSPLGAGNAAQAQTRAVTQGAEDTPSANLNAAQTAADRIEPVAVSGGTSDVEARERESTRVTASEDVVRRPAPPSEFERYVERVLGRKLPRFGSDLLVPGSRDFATPATASVPPSYLLNVGDQVIIGMTGSVEGTVSAEIDTNGRIFLPRVGAVQLAGVRYSDLRSTITRAIGRQYRDFRVTVSIGQLRGIRVYVTGFANNPGAYTVSSLSTLANAVLAAGGPSAGGSFRTMQLLRDGRIISTFDLYDLIRGGDRSADAILQNEDVINIPAVGEQVAMAGSVNAEAIYEAKPGESLERLLAYAGGTNALADKSRVMLYRLSNLDTIGGQEVPRGELPRTLAEGGDIVQVLSVGTIARPLERQSVLVRLEGEVARPGNYYVPPNTPLETVMQMAGGTTSRAFIYGTRVERVSVREQQRAGFEEAIRQLEVSLAATPLTGDQTIDPGTRVAQVAAGQALLQRLREAQPDGRVVLNVQPSAVALPGQISLENNDRIYVPPRPETVGVFGAVYRPASFLLEGGRPKTVRQYLQEAGGPLRVADRGQIFIVRANGSVLSKPNGALNARVLPGDVIFVPTKTQASSVFQKILQVTTVLFQLGLAAATIVAVTN